MASIALHVTAAVVILEAHDVAAAFGYDLPAKYDILHRLRGWRRLGRVIDGCQLREHPGAILLAEDREDMAALLYYVRPHPLDALKWNGDDSTPHDQFDIDAKPRALSRRRFPAGEPRPPTSRRSSRALPRPGRSGTSSSRSAAAITRDFVVRYLQGFKGYR